jgi:large subunit ribosomal protein L2
MKLKKYNPLTPGRRFFIKCNTEHLWKGKPIKSLTKGMNKTGGRNNTGRITSRHIGGGQKQSYRMVDFKRNKLDMYAIVQRTEYDPSRTAFLALIKYEDGTLSYILATKAMKAGDKVISTNGPVDSLYGNCLPLEYIPIGTTLHNVELKPQKGGQIGRSAGACVKLIGKDNGYAQLKLQSSEIRLVSLSCRATIGIVANEDHKNTVHGKAGRVRNLGRRPHVRGVAMNPVDHPHSGGEGKTSGGRHPVTPWGKSTKGKKTRANKRTLRYIIKSRKKK